jgi:hypothetical protein
VRMYATARSRIGGKVSVMGVSLIEG